MIGGDAPAGQVPRLCRWHQRPRGHSHSSGWRARRRWYPGRVYDMLRRRALRADSIRMFVLDEADEMLSRGFKDQIYDIFQLLPPKLQVCAAFLL